MNAMPHASSRWWTIGLLWLAAALLVTSCSSNTATPPPTTSIAPQGSAQEYFQLGNSYVKQGQYQEAETAYKQAIALEPSNPDYYANLGVAYYSMQRLAEAVDAYRDALRYAPADAQISYLLGAALLQLNRLDEAEEAFVEANRADPNLGEPYFGLGVLYRLQGDSAQAISAFEKFLEIGPSANGDPNAVPAAEAELEALRSGQ
jgi:tetratricopeptide (TPR) repeat protein